MSENDDVPQMDVCIKVPKKRCFHFNDVNKQVCSLNEFLFHSNEQINVSFTQKVLPNGADTWIAFPRWRLLAKTYTEAVEKVFCTLYVQLNHKIRQESYIFRDFTGLINNNHIAFNQTDSKKKNIHALETSQIGYGILVMPAFTGLCGSVKQPKNENCFDLGLFEYGVFLLTHIENIFNFCKKRKICCLGDVLSRTETVSAFFDISCFNTEVDFADSFGDKFFAKGFIV